MLRGFATVSFYAADLDKARAWYAQFLGIDAYYVVPGYLEFRVGDYRHELGIIDSRYAPAGTTTSPGGEIIFWHVDDLAATRDTLLSMGATDYEPIRDRGHGFVTASVVDPFGNVLGIMTNPHYLEVLGGTISA